MKYYIDLFALVVSLFAFALSILSFQQKRINNVQSFFAQGDSKEMKEKRKTLYNIYKQNKGAVARYRMLLKKSDEMAEIVSFYDFWALMVKKNYLPKWTFQASSRYTICNVYKKLNPYIAYRREKNPKYASHFEWLVQKLQKDNAEK